MFTEQNVVGDKTGCSRPTGEEQGYKAGEAAHSSCSIVDDEVAVGGRRHFETARRSVDLHRFDLRGDGVDEQVVGVAGVDLLGSSLQTDDGAAVFANTGVLDDE